MSTSKIVQPAARKTAVAKKAPAARAATPARKKPAVAAAPVTPRANGSGVKPAKPASPTATQAAPAKPRKTKLVRDSFTMQEQEYQILSDIKRAFKVEGATVKKSELMRVAVSLLPAHDLATLKVMVARLPVLKSGSAKKAIKQG